MGVVFGANGSGYVDAMGDGAALSVREVGVLRYEHGVPYGSSNRSVRVLLCGLCNDRCAFGEPADRVCHFLLLEGV